MRKADRKGGKLALFVMAVKVNQMSLLNATSRGGSEEEGRKGREESYCSDGEEIEKGKEKKAKQL